MWMSSNLSMVVSLLPIFSVVTIINAEMTNEEKSIFYKQLEKSLTTDGNLYVLHNLFYSCENIQDTSVVIFICNKDFTVKSINYSNTNFPFFRQRSDSGYEADANCFWWDDMNHFSPCKTEEGYMAFTISASDSSSVSANRLTYYLQQILDTLQALDIFWCSILSTLAKQLNYEYILTNNITKFGTISLSLGDIPIMPSTTEAVDILSLLLSWAKYYARIYPTTTEYPRLDSDWSVIRYDCYGEYLPTQTTFTIDDHKHFILGIAIILNIAIMALAFNIIQEVSRIKAYLDEKGLEKTVAIIFWTAVPLFNVINLSWFLLSDVSMFWLNDRIHYELILVLMVIILIFELIIVYLITSNVKITSCICCFKRPIIVRAFQTYSICNIIWFAHRVSIWSIISIYYIAAAPSQTSVFIALCSSVILTNIIIITFAVHYCYSPGDKIKLAFKIILLFIFLMSIVIVFVFFTLIFVDLTQHGLSASGVGTILLSLVLPFVTFIITMVVKRYLKNEDVQSTSKERKRLVK